MILAIHTVVFIEKAILPYINGLGYYVKFFFKCNVRFLQLSKCLEEHFSKKKTFQNIFKYISQYWLSSQITDEILYANIHMKVKISVLKHCKAVIGHSIQLVKTVNTN